MNWINPFRSMLSSAFLTFLLLLVACSHRVPHATVVVLDTSLSITPRAEKAAMDALQNRVLRMQRGDLLVVIPITGNAANDAGGRILRLTAPTSRETYDADLRRFQEDARNQLTAWTASLDPRQSRTDILGALAAARQEFASMPQTSNRTLIVISDFLEDDGTYRFVSASQLANSTLARRLAAGRRKQNEFQLQGVTLCLGRLESKDFIHLTATRKEAVEAFWIDYLSDGNSRSEIHFDGDGLLADPVHGCYQESR